MSTPSKPRATRKRKTVSAGGSARSVAIGGKSSSVPPVFQRIVAELSKKPEVTVERGWSAAGVVIKRNGKMFVMLVDGEVVMKLPKIRVDQLIASSTGTRFDPRRDGRLMKEWVVLRPECAEGRRLAREAYRFALKAVR